MKTEIIPADRKDRLMTGAEYKASLNDGRRVITAEGDAITNVAEEGPYIEGIDLMSKYYDAQHDPEHRDLLTFEDEETGQRVSRAWQVPRSKEDLVKRRELTKFSTYQTFGVFGRPSDYGPIVPIGYLGIADELGEVSPEGLENVKSFLAWGKANNIMSADVIADVQSDRRVPMNQKAGRLRVVEETPEGKILYGAKPCVSAAVQSHVGTVVTALTPAANLDAAIFGWVPYNLPGMTLVSREAVTAPSNSEDHPLDYRGEESDTMMLFDHVLVPHENFFSYGDERMLPIYYKKGGLGLWHVLSRLSYKAEILVGTGQLIAEVLGTTAIPQVRDSIGELSMYATALKAYVMAAEDSAELQNGVLIPNERFITAGRLHSITEYPRMMQILRDMSGQGLISRFSSKAFNEATIKDMMHEFLPGTGVSATDKNRLFNFVWDLTSGSAAMRVALFENVNSTPPSALRARIYGSGHHKPWRDIVAERLNLQFDS